MVFAALSSSVNNSSPSDGASVSRMPPLQTLQLCADLAKGPELRVNSYAIKVEAGACAPADLADRQLLIAIRFTCDCAFGLLGSTTFSTPFLNRASILSSSTSTGAKELTPFVKPSVFQQMASLIWEQLDIRQEGKITTNSSATWSFGTP